MGKAVKGAVDKAGISNAGGGAMGNGVPGGTKTTGSNSLMGNIASGLQQVQQPGGLLRTVGAKFGDNPLGQMAGTIGEAFDPLTGQFDIAALLDKQHLQQNKDHRKIIEDLMKKGPDSNGTLTLLMRALGGGNG